MSEKKLKKKLNWEDLAGAGSQTDNLLQKILDTTQTKIFWKDRERRFLGANKAFLAYFGFPSIETILGKTDEDMGWHSDPDPFKNDEWQVLQTGISTQRVHGKCVAQGEEREIVASKSPVYESGQIVGLVGSFDDVTEEYRQRDEIGRLNETLNGIAAGIAVFKPWYDTYLCISVNAYFCQLVGASPEKFVGKKVQELLAYMHPDDREQCRQDSEGTGKRPDHMSGTYRYINHATGEYVWLFTEGKVVRKTQGETYIYYSYTNVNELKQAQTAEENLRRQYERSIEAAKLFLWVYDVKAHTITMENNPYTRACCQRLGMPKQLKNVPASLLPFAAQDSQAVLEKLYTDIDAGLPFTEADVAYTLPGEEKPKFLHLSLTASYDAEGKPVKAYGISRDISAERLAKQQYEHELAYIHADDNKNFIAKAHCDLTSNQVLEYIRDSHTAVKLEDELSYEEGCKKFAQQPVFARDREAYAKIFDREKLERDFRHGISSFSFECQRNQNLHAVTWARTDIRVCRNPVNGHLESFAYTYDVTEHHLRQQLMTNLEALGYKYLGIINIMNHSATYYGIDSRYDRRKAWLEIEDYDKSVQALLEDSVPVEEQVAALQSVKLSTIVGNLAVNGKYTYTYNWRNENGQLRRISVQYRYLDEEKQAVFFCAVDNTEEYAQEQKQVQLLKNARLEADRANEAKSMFLSSMSHDMRTPLNGILGFADLALQAQAEQLRKNYLQKIMASGHMMLDLVNDVLDLSKIESGKLELEREIFDGQELLETLLASVQQSAEEKQITLTTDLETGDAAYIRGDRSRLQQVLLNILSNAIKYTPAHGHVWFTMKQMPKDKQGHNTVITIKDDGIGMSPEFLPHVFEPFTQEHAREAGHVEGTGLGLSIVRQIVNLMGGTIEVVSTKGKGTTFTLRLFIDALGKKGQQVRSLGEQDYTLLQGKRVLVCEDNLLNMEIMQVLLQGLGIKVETAENGQEGLKKFAASRPGYYDLILMDVRMPVLDGLEATKAIRKMNKSDAKKIPIVATTADAFKEDVAKCRAAGMNAHVAKPIAKKKLFTVLLKQLNR